MPGVNSTFKGGDIGGFVVVIAGRSVPGNDLIDGGETPDCYVEVANQLIPGFKTIFPTAKPGISILTLEVRDTTQVPERETQSGLASIAKGTFMHEEGQRKGRINS